MEICIYFIVFRCIPVCIPVYLGVFRCLVGPDPDDPRCRYGLVPDCPGVDTDNLLAPWLIRVISWQSGGCPWWCRGYSGLNRRQDVARLASKCPGRDTDYTRTTHRLPGWVTDNTRLHPDNAGLAPDCNASRPGCFKHFKTSGTDQGPAKDEPRICHGLTRTTPDSWSGWSRAWSGCGHDRQGSGCGHPGLSMSYRGSPGIVCGSGGTKMWLVWFQNVPDETRRTPRLPRWIMDYTRFTPGWCWINPGSPRMF